MWSGLDFLPVIVDSVERKSLRNSALRRWVVQARVELCERRQRRAVPRPLRAPRTYLLRWQVVERSAREELENLSQALDILDAYCRDSKPERLVLARRHFDQALRDFEQFRTALMDLSSGPGCYLAA